MKHVPLLLSIQLFSTLGCGTETPTTVVVENDYPVVADGGDTTSAVTVYKVWWVTSLLPDAVSPGAEGQPQRTVPDGDFAYAILAPGWAPSSSMPPTTLLAAKSANKLSVARGDVLHIHVSDGTFVGNCHAGKALSQDDADFVTQRVFPGDFAGAQYDAETCTSTPLPSEGGGMDDGGDAGLDASADSGG